MTAGNGEYNIPHMWPTDQEGLEKSAEEIAIRNLRSGVYKHKAHRGILQLVDVLIVSAPHHYQ